MLTLLLDIAVESPLAARDTKTRIANDDCNSADSVGAKLLNQNTHRYGSEKYV
jgi:hypothetical protein